MSTPVHRAMGAMPTGATTGHTSEVDMWHQGATEVRSEAGITILVE
jgi:hypothetical protein